MRKYTNIIDLLIFIILISSCSETYRFTLETSKRASLNSFTTFKITEANNLPIDSTHFFVNGEKIPSKGNIVKFNTKDLGIGKHTVVALNFYPGKTNKKSSYFEIFPTEKATIYGYEIVNTYPHDKTAYTQGLEFFNGYLYETTGRRGQSTLRKVELKTGRVLQKVDLADKYFGEGMTILNNKIYWLTWQNKKGFIFDLETFKLEQEFNYYNSKEGWGLTHNNSELIKSDGTNKIWFVNPNTHKESRSIQVYTNDRALDNLNELEMINGKIYANKYLNSAIIIINPKSGIAEGIVNLKGLKKEMEKTQKLEAEDEVLNGIAYDKVNDRLFVTGKNWGKIFEIKLIKK